MRESLTAEIVLEKFEAAWIYSYLKYHVEKTIPQAKGILHWVDLEQSQMAVEQRRLQEWVNNPHITNFKLYTENSVLRFAVDKDNTSCWIVKELGGAGKGFPSIPVNNTFDPISTISVSESLLNSIPVGVALYISELFAGHQSPIERKFLKDEMGWFGKSSSPQQLQERARVAASVFNSVRGRAERYGVNFPSLDKEANTDEDLTMFLRYMSGNFPLNPNASFVLKVKHRKDRIVMREDGRDRIQFLWESEKPSEIIKSVYVPTKRTAKTTPFTTPVTPGNQHPQPVTATRTQPVISQPEVRKKTLRPLPTVIAQRCKTVEELLNTFTDVELNVEQRYKLNRTKTDIADLNTLLDSYRQYSGSDEIIPEAEAILNIAVKELTALQEELESRIRNQMKIQRLYMESRHNDITLS